MLRRSLIAAAAALLLAASAAAQTADEIVAKHVQALGGADKLKSVKTLRMTGKIELAPGLSAPTTIEFSRPDSLRMEFTIQGMTGVQAYSAGTGWQLMPFQGKKDAEPLGEDDLKEAAENADWEGPLVNYKAKGHKVELVGKEKVEGTDAYKLKLTRKDGDVEYLYLDADSFLEIKSEGKRTVRGTEIEIESAAGDYKEVGGIVFPHSLEFGPKGSPQKQKLTIEKIEINPALEEARFKMPAAPKPAGNAPAAKPENKDAETKPADKRPPAAQKPPAD